MLLIIALVTGGAASLLTASVERHQFSQTQFKIKAIQDALLKYRRAFNRIPCPGDLSLAITTANFGIEAAKDAPDDETCIDLAALEPKATFQTFSTNIQIGAVPTERWAAG